MVVVVVVEEEEEVVVVVVVVIMVMVTQLLSNMPDAPHGRSAMIRAATQRKKPQIELTSQSHYTDILGGPVIG